MYTVLFSAPGPSDMWIILVGFTVVHLVVSAVLSLVIYGIVAPRKKLQARFLPIFLLSFFIGEIALFPVLYDYLFIDKLSYIYPLALAFGFICGIFFNIGRSPKEVK